MITIVMTSLKSKYTFIRLSSHVLQRHFQCQNETIKYVAATIKSVQRNLHSSQCWPLEDWNLKCRDLNTKKAISLLSCRYQSNHSDRNINCWNCHAPCPSISSSQFIQLCPNCNSLLPLTRQCNYFDIFDIKPSFDIDLTQLSHKYRELQALVHPDKFSQKAQKEHDLSLEYSSLVNKSYHTLLDAYERGQYLLQINFNDNVKEDDLNGVSNMQFLGEIMQLNEDIASATSSQQIDSIKKYITNKMKEIISQISMAFQQAQLDQVKPFLQQLKYYKTASEKLKERMLEVGL